MTTVALVLWQILLYLLLGLGLVFALVLWLFIAYAVVRLVAEFIKAYKNTESINEEELY